MNCEPTLSPQEYHALLAANRLCAMDGGDFARRDIPVDDGTGNIARVERYNGKITATIRRPREWIRYHGSGGANIEGEVVEGKEWHGLPSPPHEAPQNVIDAEFTDVPAKTRFVIHSDTQMIGHGPHGLAYPPEDKDKAGDSRLHLRGYR